MDEHRLSNRLANELAPTGVWLRRRGSLERYKNLNTVVWVYVLPGSSLVLWNFGWFGASG